MKIGIIGAMEEEVTLLRDKIENRQTLEAQATVDNLTITQGSAVINVTVAFNFNALSIFKKNLLFLQFNNRNVSKSAGRQGRVESRGREGGVETPLPASGPRGAQSHLTIK